MLSARASLVAGCVALAAIAALPAGGGVVRGAEEPGACSDERVWQPHRGRVAMFSMYPAGRLTPKGGASRDFEYQGGLLYPAPERNTYTDEAGVEWILQTDGQSVYHQPGWGDSPNKKFVARDAQGGSFEAILQPDGARTWSSSGPSGALTYRNLNWLRDARGMKWMGTYNYSDASDPVSIPGLLHWVADVRPHEKAPDYAPIPKGLTELDPRTVRWRTYVPRALKLVDLFARPAGSELPPARLVANGSESVVVQGEAEQAVDSDLVPLAKYLAGCLGEDEIAECEKLAIDLVPLSAAGRRHLDFLEARHIANQAICHDFNGDGREDVAFAISGGGTGLSFEWTVFVGRPDAAEDAPLERRFRELEVRFVESKTALSREGDRIVVRNPIFLPGDPNCCPRGGVTRRTFQVTTRKVSLVKTERLPPG